MRFGTSVCLKNDVLDSEMGRSPLSLKCQFECLGSPKFTGIPLGVWGTLKKIPLPKQQLHGQRSQKNFLDMAGEKHQKEDRDP